MRLTAKAVEKLRHSGAERQKDIKDDQTTGLYLRLFITGHKVWIYRYKRRGKVSVFKLGDADVLSLAAAREAAQGARNKVRQGIDLSAEKQRARAASELMPTVESFATEYIERYAKPNKRSWSEDERLLQREVVPEIGLIPLNEVHRRDVIALLDRIRDRGAFILSNRVLAVVRRMFGFAVERGVLEATPITHVRALRETPRDRVFSDAELQRLWYATEVSSPNVDSIAPPIESEVDTRPVPMLPATRLALRFTLLTGARSGEVCGLERGELDLDAVNGPRWMLPAGRSKNGLAHTVPLSSMAVTVLNEALVVSSFGHWVFPASRGLAHLTGYALSQAMGRIFRDVKGRPTVHDLRRTVGTRLGELGCNRLVVDKVLNHKDRSVGGIYDRHAYDREKREALEAWARQLQDLLEIDEQQANIVVLMDAHASGRQ